MPYIPLDLLHYCVSYFHSVAATYAHREALSLHSNYLRLRALVLLMRKLKSPLFTIRVFKPICVHTWTYITVHTLTL